MTGCRLEGLGRGLDESNGVGDVGREGDDSDAGGRRVSACSMAFQGVELIV